MTASLPDLTLAKITIRKAPKGWNNYTAPKLVLSDFTAHEMFVSVALVRVPAGRNALVKNLCFPRGAKNPAGRILGRTTCLRDSRRIDGGGGIARKVTLRYSINHSWAHHGAGLSY
jgi:hypothetical protein